jgi:hypothetical protein
MWRLLKTELSRTSLPPTDNILLFQRFNLFWKRSATCFQTLFISFLWCIGILIYLNRNESKSHLKNLCIIDLIRFGKQAAPKVSSGQPTRATKEICHQQAAASAQRVLRCLRMSCSQFTGPFIRCWPRSSYLSSVISSLSMDKGNCMHNHAYHYH